MIPPKTHYYKTVMKLRKKPIRACAIPTHQQMPTSKTKTFNLENEFNYKFACGQPYPLTKRLIIINFVKSIPPRNQPPTGENFPSPPKKCRKIIKPLLLVLSSLTCNEMESVKISQPRRELFREISTSHHLVVHLDNCSYCVDI